VKIEAATRGRRTRRDTQRYQSVTDSSMSCERGMAVMSLFPDRLYATPNRASTTMKNITDPDELVDD